jgi:hypothetical protein
VCASSSDGECETRRWGTVDHSGQARGREAEHCAPYGTGPRCTATARTH